MILMIGWWDICGWKISESSVICWVNSGDRSEIKFRKFIMWWDGCLFTLWNVTLKSSQRKNLQVLQFYIFRWLITFCHIPKEKIRFQSILFYKYLIMLMQNVTYITIIAFKASTLVYLMLNLVSYSFIQSLMLFSY